MTNSFSSYALFLLQYFIRGSLHDITLGANAQFNGINIVNGWCVFPKRDNAAKTHLVYRFSNCFILMHFSHPIICVAYLVSPKGNVVLHNSDSILATITHERIVNINWIAGKGSVFC